MKNRTPQNRINGLSLLAGLVVVCSALIGCHTSNNAASNMRKSTQVIDVDDPNPMVRKSASVYVGELLTVRASQPALHIIVTGRDAPPRLIEVADLVTEMREIKHPFQAGIRAQRGIEF